MRRILFVLLLSAALVGCSTGTSTASPVPSPAQTAVATVSPTRIETPAPTIAPSTPPSAPAAETASPAPTRTPAPTPTPVCNAAQLKATVTEWSGAAGSQIASVTMQNSSSSACALQGTPGLQLVDAHDIVFIDSATVGDGGLPRVEPGDKIFLVEPGALIATEVRVSNYCGDLKATLPTTVAFLLPSDGGRLVAAPGPGGAVPGCMSSPGTPGSIDTNGWTR